MKETDLEALLPLVRETFTEALASRLKVFRLNLFIHDFDAAYPLLGVEIVVSGIDEQYKALAVQQELYGKCTKLHEVLWMMQNVDTGLRKKTEV